MDSPVRKQQKRNDYLRHKMFRKINRRRKAERQQAINAPAKELRKRLRRRTFKCGKDAYSGGKDNDIVPFKQREEVIITPDVEYNAYLNTLPDNQRFTPNDAYDSYYYWQLNGKPKDFVEAYNKGMFTYDNSDGMYHANSVAFGKDGNGHFMKPKTHDTVGYELDWYNNGIITEEGGKQRQAKGKEKREWQKFKKKYELVDDPDRPNFYMYRKRSLKKPKFAPGKDDDDIIFGEVPYPLYDQYGNLLDLNTGAIGTTALPNVEVVADPEDVARGRAQRWYRDFGIEPNDATSTSLTTNHHLKQRSEEGAAKAAAWAKDHPILNNVGLGLSAIPLGVAAAPAVVGGGELAATALANPYVDAALTSMGGAHAAQSLANGEANWMTALELAPLGRLAKPLYEGVVQPGMRLFNSPLTGNWTRIGNREYRFKPGYLGMNGTPVESRAVTMTDAEWDAAYNAALKSLDMKEVQRLRDLHFRVKTPNNQLINEFGEPFIMKHYGNKWTEFNPDETMDGVLWNADANAFKLDEIETFEKVGLPTEWKNLFINMEKPIYDEVTNYTAKLLSRAKKGDKEAAEELFKTYGVSNPDGLVKKLKLTEDALRKQGLDVSAEEIQHLKDIGVYGEESAMSVAPYPNKIKLADAITYDNEGNIIPLSQRDNFGVNDIRYSWLPWLLGGASATTLYNVNK